jgi:uncharacterized protein
MKVTNGKWKISSRDLFKESCEHCTRLDMAVAAQVPEALERVGPYVEDLSQVVFILQGNEYEDFIFKQFSDQLGHGFVELERATMEQTIDLLRAGIPVIAQGFLETEIEGYLWSGYPDLLIRDDFTYENGRVFQHKEPGPSPKYVVWDVKASSSPDEKYWLQVASYSKVLEMLQLASSDELGIIAKRQTAFRFPREEALDRLEKATKTLLNRLALTTPNLIDQTFIKQWRCDKPTTCKKATCSYPKHCEHLFEVEHSLHLLYGRNPIEKMNADGIYSYDDLLANQNPIWEKSRRWAQLLRKETESGQPYFELTNKKQWLEIPIPTEDDLFFDIEWFTSVLDEDPLVFEFGFVDAKENFTSLDGFTREDELPNFKKFVEIAKLKSDSNPLARIYHYSNPEVTYLNKLVEKYNIFHDEVKLIISRMIDLRTIATSMVLPGANGYSIKQLERYYDADTKLNRKANGVSDGADAMLLFYKATVTEPDKAEEHMNTIRAYNRDDCLSTKLLRDWLLNLGLMETTP